MIARVATWFEDEDPGTIRRWAIVGAAVVVLHFLVLSPYVYFFHPEQQLGDDTSPISLDLAPSNDTVDQAEVLPTPEAQDEPPPPPDPQPPPPPPQPQAIVEAPPPPPPKIEEQPQQAAPQEARTKGGAPPVPANWITSVTRRLEHFKRVPSKAVTKAVIVQVAFTVDRGGHILSREIEKSSGRPELDAAAISMIERAQPLPAFLQSMTQSEINLTVPISFTPAEP
jgi:periplasmic protein TonB